MYDSYTRFRDCLPRSRDPVLVVLKAHLLAEERLDDVLRWLSRSKGALSEARLTFHQKLKLCNALLGETASPQWRFLAALNNLRNALSHRVEVQDVDRRIDAAIRTLEPADTTKFRGRAQRLTALKNAVILSCAFVEGIATEATQRAARDRHLGNAPAKRLQPVAPAAIVRRRG